jgi:hypothetical protein
MKKKRLSKKKLKLTKKLILIIIILLLAIAVSSLTFTGYSIKDFFGFKKSLPLQNPGTIQNIAVTKQNLAMFLQGTNLVQEMHKNAEIQLNLYNFNTGSREWEETYVIKKAQVYQGTAEDPDVVAILSSDYIEGLGNLCPTMQTANTKGDFGLEYKKNTASLLWKYKGMMKYKPCFGF